MASLDQCSDGAGEIRLPESVPLTHTTPTAPPPRLALHPGEVMAQVLPGLPNVVRSQPAQGAP